MAVEAHMAEIKSRHRALEDKIEEIQLHPAADSLELARLKREKLRLKDELAKLESSHAAN